MLSSIASYIPSGASVLAFFQWLLVTGWTKLVDAYHASPKWFAIAVAAFLLMIWLGYAHAPKIESHDADVAKQVALLSAKIDRLEANIDALKVTPVAPVAAKKKFSK
jgi:hypothetical protein